MHAYFDLNERKYYITPESVGEGVPNRSSGEKDASAERSETLEKEVLDLKVLNSGKDFLIEQLREER